MQEDRSTVSFPEPADVGPRQWGREILLLHVPGWFTLKRIEMKRGAKGGLQYHHLKNEGGVMVSGIMMVHYDDGTHELKRRVLLPGDVFHFPPKTVHQAIALTNVVYIEASSPHFNDRVHCERDYGLEHEDGGLPSTNLEDVIEA